MKDDRICSASPINKCKKMGKHLCASCGEEVYCSRECQKEHWQAHKLACQLAVKPESTVILKDFESLSIKQLKNILKAKAASFDSTKRASIISRMDSIIEKPVLVKLVNEFVTLPEVESLLGVKSSSIEGSSSSSGGRNSSSRGSKASGQVPTPEQLKQQATMMRQNPDMMRNMQPAFKNMTDEQIRAYADQLELAASDPSMMKEMEKMSKLSTSDRSALQSIQDGLTGIKAIDSDWMDTTIDTLKSKPKLFKTLLAGKGPMLNGITDEQLISFVDMASNMDAYVLKLIMRLFKFLASIAKPAMETYKLVDDFTLGCGKYLGILLLVYLAYYMGLGMWIAMKWTYRQLTALFMMVFYASSVVGGTSAAGAAGETIVKAASAGASVASTSTTGAAQAAMGAAGAAAGVAAGAAGLKSGSVFGGKKKVVSPDDEFEF
jgi:hypothetical protein